MCEAVQNRFCSLVHLGNYKGALILTAQHPSLGPDFPKCLASRDFDATPLARLSEDTDLDLELLIFYFPLISVPKRELGCLYNLPPILWG